MSSATAECERCRDGDSHNHWDHRTKETFQSIYDRVKFHAENKPRDYGADSQSWLKELRGVMRELLTKHVERAIGRQIEETKAIFRNSTLCPHYGDPDAPNYFRWALNGKYLGFPKVKMSSWSQSDILRCFKALESHELYIEDLEEEPVLDEAQLQLVTAARNAFTQYISEFTGNHVNDLQKCLVGDGSAGLKDWKWDFEWFEKFNEFPHQRLLWKWKDKDLIASMEVLKNGSLKLVRNERLRSSSASASCEKIVKKETKAANAARRRRKTMVLSSDDEDDEEDGPHDDDEHDDDFDSGSTVIVDEGSSSGEFEGYLPMTRQLLKYPARIAKLEIKVSKLQTLNSTLRDRNKILSMKIEDTEKEQRSDKLNNVLLLEKIEEMRAKCSDLEQRDKETTRKCAALEQQNTEMKTKCDRLARKNEELSRKYAVSVQRQEEVTALAFNAISEEAERLAQCATLNDQLREDIKTNNLLKGLGGLLPRSERSQSPVLEASNRPTKIPDPTAQQESPRKTHARPSNTLAASKISQNLGLLARNRLLQPTSSKRSPSKQSPTRPTRPALGPKPNSAHVSKFNCQTPSSNGREGTGTIAKNTPAAQGSENIAHGGTEWLRKESPDCKFVRSRLADDQGGQNFSFKRERSDDERLQTTSKKARN